MLVPCKIYLMPASKYQEIIEERDESRCWLEMIDATPDMLSPSNGPSQLLIEARCLEVENDESQIPNESFEFRPFDISAASRLRELQELITAEKGIGAKSGFNFN